MVGADMMFCIFDVLVLPECSESQHERTTHTQHGAKNRRACEVHFVYLSYLGYMSNRQSKRCSMIF